MRRFLQQLEQRLAHDQRRSMRRSLRTVPGAGKYIAFDDRRLLNLASNDYLGLAQHPRLGEAAAQAIRAQGTGATASRLVVGHTPLHERADQAFAAFKHTDAALLFPTGFTANLAVLTTLAKHGDLICIDKLTHASLIDAAHASPAQTRVYPHLNLDKLDRLITRHRSRTGKDDSQIFIVTDAVFSMDGDCADLPALCDLATSYDAVLVVDEAHGTGVLGGTGAGLAEHQGVADRAMITIATASKALGGLGGIVAGPKPVIDTLINKARPFIYTTAPPPSQPAALLAALALLRDEPQRRQHLRDISRYVRDRLPARFTLPVSDRANNPPTPIIPLITGSPESALRLSDYLKAQGIYAVAIRPPTVAPGSSRVRLCLRADLADAEVEHLLEAIAAAPDS